MIIIIIMMATRCIEENVKKARGAFFKLGVLTLQGDLSPLSTKSIIGMFVHAAIEFSCMGLKIGYLQRTTSGL